MMTALVFPILSCFAAVAGAEENAPKAARSAHLWYAAPDASIFYNEVTVQKSVPGSYFCVCGFKHGYFGIQELRGPDDKVVIFSVWDPGQQDDPNSVASDRRVEILYRGEDVRVGRFGGEGTGGQSFFRYPWKVGETCRFLVRATVNGNKTAYAAYFFRNDTREWKHLVTFQTITGGDPLRGFYSFIEDFRRDGKSVAQRRSARYTNGWVQTVKGDWVSLTRVKFTADRTPLLNIDAGTTENGFWLATGGDTPAGTPLGSTLTRPPAGLSLPAFDMPKTPATAPSP